MDSSILVALDAWCDAVSLSDINSAISKILSAASEIPTLSELQFVQLLTNMFQARVRAAGQHTTGSQIDIAMHQALLDKLTQLLLSITPSARIFSALNEVVALHTPELTAVGQSRRNSFSLNAAAAGNVFMLNQGNSTAASKAGSVVPSRRGSLMANQLAIAAAAAASSPNAATPEESIATIRLLTIKFCLEYSRRWCATIAEAPNERTLANASASTTTSAAPSEYPSPSPSPLPTSPNSPTFFSSSLISYTQSLYLLGLSDMWSAIRKVTASHLRDSKIVAMMKQGEMKQLVQGMMRMGGVASYVSNDSSSSNQDLTSKESRMIMSIRWQIQEGAMLGISALLSALLSSSSLSTTSTSSPYFPPFLMNLQPDCFFPFLSHSQLSVREATTKVLQYLVRLRETSGEGGKEIKLAMYRSIMKKLREGTHVQTSTQATSPQQQSQTEKDLRWLTDYEAEGILTVVHRLKLAEVVGGGATASDATGLSDIDVFDHYLAHPASTVRQQVSEILSHMASASSASFDALNHFSVDWQWTERDHCPMDDATKLNEATSHTSAVYFSIPPPIVIPYSLSRRTSRTNQPNSGRRESGDHSSAAAAASVSPPAIVVMSEATPTPSTVETPAKVKPHRATWQWKEGALMTLELYLRSVASTPNAISNSVSLAPLYQQILRSCFSHSWELRRMSEQLWRPFYSVWFRSEKAGAEWTDLATIKPESNVNETAQSVMAMLQGLQYLYKSITQASNQQDSSSSSSSIPTTKEDSSDRKWHPEVSGELVVHTQVWKDIAHGLPGLLTRLESIIVESEFTMNSGVEVALGEEGIVAWEQVATISMQVVITAYALFGPSSTPSASFASLPSALTTLPATMHVTPQIRVQHYQCVLDRLRVIRNLGLGETAPSISVAAIMPRSPAAGGSSPGGPLRSLESPRTPPLPSISSSVLSPHQHHSRLATLPGISSISVHTGALRSHHQPTVSPLTRSCAKRLEAWFLQHVSPQMYAFTSCVSEETRMDLIELLQEYLTRCTTLTHDTRIVFLRSVTTAWNHVHVEMVSHTRINELRSYGLESMIKLMQQHSTERADTIAALRAIIKHASEGQVKQVLQQIAQMIDEEDLAISLSAPPPTSAQDESSSSAPAVNDTWNDWDEGIEVDQPQSQSQQQGGKKVVLTPHQRYQRAKALVHDVGSLVRSLCTVPITGDSKNQEAAESQVTSPHAQSDRPSLSQLVASYDMMFTTSPSPANRVQQQEILSRIQTRVSELQEQLKKQQQAQKNRALNVQRPLYWSNFSDTTKNKLMWIIQQMDE